MPSCAILAGVLYLGRYFGRQQCIERHDRINPQRTSGQDSDEDLDPEVRFFLS